MAARVLSFWRRRCLAGVLLPGLVAPAGAGLMEGVKAMPPMKPGAPDRTEVLFSVRFPRADAMDVARAYGATRIVWHYAADAGFVARMRSAVPRVGLSMNANGPLSDPAGRVLGFDGQSLSAPWMKTWGVHWVSSTHPAARESAAREVQRLVALGADTLQFDDPTLQLFAGLYQAGDFNPATQRGFRPWLEANVSAAERQRLGLDTLGADYRDWLRRQHGVQDAADYLRRWRSLPSSALWLRYLRATVVEHFTWLKRAAAAEAGRPVPLSMNLSGLTEPAEVNPHHFLLDVADFVMSESTITDRPRLVSQWAVARSAGLGNAPSILPGTLAENRTAIAHLYALGATPLVPWDTYDGNDAQSRPQRFFGAPADYADLFRFVRAHPDLHQGLEVSPTVGVVVPVQAIEPTRVRQFMQRLDQRQIPYRFVMADEQGLRSADAAQLATLDHLWLVGSPDRLSPAARAAMGIQALQRLREDRSLTEAELDHAQPLLVAPGAATLRIVPRVDPNRADRLLLHLIDESRATTPQADGECRRRVGVAHAQLDGRRISSARVTALGSTGQTEVAVEPSGEVTYLTVRSCAFWTVLELSLSRAGASDLTVPP
jgi:hypothetical protein